MIQSAAPEQVLEQPFTGYRVIEKIELGENAVLFTAHDTRLDRPVAIKALIPDLAGNEDAVERFFTEARNVARLRHPKIVRGLDVGRSGKYFYFVTEHVRGESLAQRLTRLERGKLAEAKTLEIVRDIAEALQCVFENGLVHRDVKPENILLAAEGPAMLCDLGVAREVTCRRPEDVVRASPYYASPEQAECDPIIDIRADLYSLGCTWFHMLLGTPPFKAATIIEILQQQIDVPPPNPREVDVRISAATSRLILWLLEKDRDARPRTPQEFLVKLATHPLLQGEAQAKPISTEAPATDGEDGAGEG